MSPRPRDDERLAGSEIAIVGAGFGGLSAAAYLADAGADVTVSASVSDAVIEDATGDGMLPSVVSTSTLR